MRFLIVSSDRTDVHGGACNLGDALLTDALATAIADRGHIAEIYDFGEARTTTDLQRIARGRGLGLWRTIGDVDGVILGGGTMFQDDQPQQFAAGLPRLCATVSAFTRGRRKPLRVYGVGCDSIQRRVPRLLLRLAVADSSVWLRDLDSCERFESYFGRTPHYGADAAMLLDDQLAPPHDSRRGCVIALNRTEASMLTLGVIATLEASGTRPTFLSMEQQNEGSDGDALTDSTREALGYGREVTGWRSAAARVAASEMVVASRMHALYLAVLTGTPAVAVGNREKVRSFAREFDIPLVDRVDAVLPGMARVANPTAVMSARRRAHDSLDELLAASAVH